MGIKLTLLIFFCALMIAIGILTRRRTHGVDEFVLGGRTVGPWLTAFAFGTSYFSAVIFIRLLFIRVSPGFSPWPFISTMLTV